MMFLPPLGLDNSTLPGKAKLFAFILSTPRACFLEILLVQQCTFLDHFCRHLRVNSPQWKSSDPYAPTTTGITFVLSPRSFGTSLARSWYFSAFTASFFLTRPSFVIGKSIIWQHLCLLSTKSGLLAAIHDLFEHWIPPKTWSFLLSFRLNLHFPAKTRWIAPPTLSFLLFDSCASFGHELRIWLTVLASALRLVNLCFHVIST